MKGFLRMTLLIAAIATLAAGGLLGFAGAVTLEPAQSAVICHATPPDDPNKFIVIVTDNQTIINGHLEEHDFDKLLTILDKPPQQVTQEERDALEEQCNEVPPAPPATGQPGAPGVTG